MLAAVLASLLGACGGPAAGPAAGFDHLLLVTFDTTRADRLGAYGHAAAATPVLDRLAAEGVLFERCFAVAPVTLPAHASLLTGLYPFHHGARNNGTHTLPPDVPTLAEALAAQGFATGAVVASVVLDSRYGLDRGFDRYDDDLSGAGRTDHAMLRDTVAGDVARRALAWLDERGDERWFLWVHFFDPHATHQPPPEFAALCPGDPYDGEIAYADAALGRVLAAIERRGQLERTLVAFTADHGESLGEHGEPSHGLFLHDATTHVPLILRHPALAAGARRRGPCSQVDLAPTVLELLGVPGLSRGDGVSLAAAARGEAESVRGPLYQESMAPRFQHGWAPLRALRGDGFRYVEAPREEFYDLAADPGEVADLAAAQSARLAELRRTLHELLAGGERDSRRAPADMSAAERSALDALGYVQSEGAAEIAGAAAIDPKDRVAAWRDTILAYELVGAKDWAAAEPAVRTLVELSPASVEAHRMLARTLRGLDRPREALLELRACLALPGLDAETLLLLADLERELGEASWRERLAGARRLEPRDPTPWVMSGDFARTAGDASAARADYERALALDPDCAAAWRGLGELRLAAGDVAGAEEALAAAVTRDPWSFDAWLAWAAAAEAGGRASDALGRLDGAERALPGAALTEVRRGNLLFRAGRLDEAEAAFRAALMRRPDHFEASYNLGTVLIERGEPAEAAAHFAAAAERRPRELAPLLAAAAACQAAGRGAEAAAWLRRARELDPTATAAAVAEDPLLGAIAGG